VASSESAGHGKTIGLGVIDEAFDDVDNRREQALLPAMRTVRDAQLVICSTMGTQTSTYLNAKVDAGRMLAVADSDEGRIAYFEWSAPDDADPGDPAVWAACSPALGYTLELGTIESEYQSAVSAGKLGEFQRFALNQRTASDERLIPAAVWDRCRTDGHVDAAKVFFALDCDPDRSRATIAKASTDHCEIVESDVGTAWVIHRAKDLCSRYHAALAVDPASPAGALIGDLTNAGVRVFELGGQDFVKACGSFFDAVADTKIRIRSDGRLDQAVAGAKRRPVGDAWAWARKTSTVDITPLVAVTLACYAASQGPGLSKCWPAEEELTSVPAAGSIVWE
jgi:hypothetical protein